MKFFVEVYRTWNDRFFTLTYQGETRAECGEVVAEGRMFYAVNDAKGAAIDDIREICDEQGINAESQEILFSATTESDRRAEFTPGQRTPA